MLGKIILRRMILVASIFAVLFSGCTSESPKIEDGQTLTQTPVPTITTVITFTHTPEVTKTIERTPEEKIALRDVNIILKDSPSVIDPTTIDKLFTITHQEGEQIPASELRIDVFQEDELIDSLKFVASAKSYEGEKLKSTSFFDERLDPGDTIAILETPDFFNLPSYSTLTVRVVDIRSGQSLLEESIEII